MVLALHDAALTGAVLALAIMLLGCAFLLILRTPRRPYGLRFLLLTVAVVAVAFGVWAALLRSSGIFSLPEGEGGPVTAPHAPSDRKPESNGALPSSPDGCAAEHPRRNRVARLFDPVAPGVPS